MRLSPDDLIFWQWGFITINATLVFSWLIMVLLVGLSLVLTRRLSSTEKISGGQNALEAIISFLQAEIAEVSQQNPAPLLPFIGTLFLFILTANVLSIVPGFEPPTGSLSTTAALSVCVMLAVPFYGVQKKGLKAYLRQYIEPSVIMLPFNIISELSRTLSLAVRLFGNVMSGSVVVAILLLIAPLFFPIIMQALGLLIGVIQAYIFAILAVVFIASGMATPDKSSLTEEQQGV